MIIMINQHLSVNLYVKIKSQFNFFVKILQSISSLSPLLWASMFQKYDFAILFLRVLIFWFFLWTCKFLL